MVSTFSYFKNFVKKKKGIAIVMFVVLFPIFIAILGLSIDIGSLIFYNYKLQTACRLSALTGGAYSFPDGSGKYEITDIAKAEALARENFWLNMSGVPGEKVSNVIVYPKATKKSIRVRATMDVQFYFIPIVDGPSRTRIAEYYDVNIN